jgi:SAM-dependent methyltransferase
MNGETRRIEGRSQSSGLAKYLKKLNEALFFPIRYKRLVRSLSPMIGDDKKILDVGAANGELARRLKDALPIEILGIDIAVQPNSSIPVLLYDGKNLPFHDDSFECVLLIDVLHHDRNPRRLLEEAARVSRRHVIVKDHYWTNGLDLHLLKLSDFLGNKCYGIRLPYNFLTLQQWSELWETSGLEVLERRDLRVHIMDICRNIQFKLRVSSG